MLPKIAADQVREHLDKILKSPEFENSDRLQRFLRFSVEAVLSGEQDKVKEYVIGREVFDRDDLYDPRVDPIVRVEARRLRKKLEAYYASSALADGMRLDFPKGSYIPAIQVAPSSEAAPDGAQSRKLPWRRVAAACFVLAAAAAVWLYFGERTGAPASTVAVLPARWIWTGEDFPDTPVDEDLAERLTANLAKRGEWAVTGWPVLQKYRGKALKIREFAAEAGVDRVVVLAVRVESDGFRATAFLLDAKSDRKLMVADRRGVDLHSPGSREKLAADLAAELPGVRAR